MLPIEPYRERWVELLESAHRDDLAAGLPDVSALQELEERRNEVAKALLLEFGDSAYNYRDTIVWSTQGEWGHRHHEVGARLVRAIRPMIDEALAMDRLVNFVPADVAGSDVFTLIIHPAIITPLDLRMPALNRWGEDYAADLRLAAVEGDTERVQRIVRGWLAQSASRPDSPEFMAQFNVRQERRSLAEACLWLTHEGLLPAEIADEIADALQEPWPPMNMRAFFEMMRLTTDIEHRHWFERTQAVAWGEVIESMVDDYGGWKSSDPILWRDRLVSHAEVQRRLDLHFSELERVAPVPLGRKWPRLVPLRDEDPDDVKRMGLSDVTRAELASSYRRIHVSLMMQEIETHAMAAAIRVASYRHETGHLPSSLDEAMTAEQATAPYFNERYSYKRLEGEEWFELGPPDNPHAWRRVFGTDERMWGGETVPPMNVVRPRDAVEDSFGP